jgi:hypothetical protein
MHVYFMKITMRFTWALQRNPTASMTNNPPTGYHLNNLWVLRCKQQIIALSKVCNVNNTNVLEQKIVVFSLVATSHLQPMTPQNRHLGDYSDQATIYVMSLWKRTTKRNMHITTYILCGWNQGSNSYTSSRWNPQKNII